MEYFFNGIIMKKKEQYEYGITYIESSKDYKKYI